MPIPIDVKGDSLVDAKSERQKCNPLSLNIDMGQPLE